VTATSAAIGAGLTLIGRDTVHAYSVQQDAVASLKASMTAAGTFTQQSLADYQQFASELQSVTTTGDEATLAMLQHAESLGVTGESAKRAAQNAVAMQNALGVNAESALKMTLALEQGQTSLLNEYMPALRSIKDPAERAAMAQQMLTKMFATAQANAQTYAGQTQQLTNAWGDLKEEFGAVVADGMTPLVAWARQGVASIASWSTETKTLIAYTGMAADGLAGFVTVGGSVVAMAGQAVIAYGALQQSATGAKVAQLALNTAVGVGYVAAVGAALVAGYSIGTMLVNQTQWAKDAAKAYEDYAAGVKALQSREAKEREDTLARIQAAPQQQRGTLLSAEMEMAQKQLEGLTARTEMAREEMDRLKPTWLSMGQAGKKLWEAQSAEYEDLRTRAAEAGRWVNTLESEMRKAGQAAAGMTPTPATPAAAGMTPTPATPAAAAFDAAQMVRSMQQQIQWAGASEDQLAMLRLQAQGLSGDWLHVIGIMQRDLGVAKRTAEARAEVERMHQSLREQIATQRLGAAGWSPEQIERWKLAQRGATAEQVQQLAVLQQQAAAMKTQQDNQAAAKQRQEALRGSLADTTKRLKEQIATAGMSPEEIELYKLKEQGASREQLAQVAMLQQQASASANKGTGPGPAIKPPALPTAAIAGTREAAERIAAYRDQQRDRKQSDKTPWERQLSIQERIAATLDKILGATGLTIEEIA